MSNHGICMGVMSASVARKRGMAYWRFLGLRRVPVRDTHLAGLFDWAPERTNSNYVAKFGVSQTRGVVPIDCWDRLSFLTHRHMGQATAGQTSRGTPCRLTCGQWTLDRAHSLVGRSAERHILLLS